MGVDRAIGRGASLGIAAVAVLLVSGCAEAIPLPVRARTMEASECRDGPPAEDEARAVEAMTVLDARPRFHQNPCNGACQVLGVNVLVRPPQGVTLTQFARTLRCHNLRVLDGEVDASRIPNDPYGLRDSWLEIDVKHEGSNFLVTLSGDQTADNLQILQRAKAYAAAHGPGAR